MLAILTKMEAFIVDTQGMLNSVIFRPVIHSHTIRINQIKKKKWNFSEIQMFPP